MDVAGLAAAVVGLVVPYLQQAGDQLAGGIVDEAVARVRRLYETLRSRLRDGSYEANQLAGVADRPESEGRAAALRSALEEHLADDPELAAELHRLVAEARAAGASVRAIDSGITAGGDVNVVAGRDVAGRDFAGRDRTT